VDAERQILVFTVSGHQYAMDVLDLREVSRLPTKPPEHGTPDGVVGVVRMHDRPVRVYDMAHALKQVWSGPIGGKLRAGNSGPADTRSWVIVSREGDHDRHWRVDEVADIVAYDPESVTFPEDDRDSPGMLELNGGLTYLLSAQTLARGVTR
jgi:chemotaxis signal transduction protein